MVKLKILGLVPLTSVCLYASFKILFYTVLLIPIRKSGTAMAAHLSTCVFKDVLCLVDFCNQKLPMR